MATQSAVRMTENSFREKYERYVKQDPGNPDVRRQALAAVAAKTARVVYALVKRLEPYRGYHEQALPSGSIPLNRAVGALATPGTLRCVQDRKGRGAARPDLVFTMVSGVSSRRGSPLRMFMLVTARSFGDSSSRKRGCLCTAAQSGACS
jgi:hypothetical protein